MYSEATWPVDMECPAASEYFTSSTKPWVSSEYTSADSAFHYRLPLQQIYWESSEYTSADAVSRLRLPLQQSFWESSEHASADADPRSHSPFLQCYSNTLPFVEVSTLTSMASYGDNLVSLDSGTNFMDFGTNYMDSGTNFNQAFPPKASTTCCECISSLSMSSEFDIYPFSTIPVLDCYASEIDPALTEEHPIGENQSIGDPPPDETLHEQVQPQQYSNLQAASATLTQFVDSNGQIHMGYITQEQPKSTIRDSTSARAPSARANSVQFQHPGPSAVPRARVDHSIYPLLPRPRPYSQYYRLQSRLNNLTIPSTLGASGPVISDNKVEVGRDAEAMASRSWGLGEATRRTLLWMNKLARWRARLPSRPNPKPPTLVQAYEALARQAQEGMPPPSQYAAFYDPERQLWVTRVISVTGGSRFLPYIPKECTHLRRLIVKTAHRSVLHSGVDATLARASRYFYAPALMRECKRLVKYCHHCQARRRPVEKVPREKKEDQVKRSLAPPYTYVGMDVLTLDGQKVLTTRCCVSGHVTWLLIPSEKAKDLALGVEAIFYRIGTGFRFIFSDQGPGFASPVFRKALGERLPMEPEFRYTPPNAPWMYGYERPHLDGAQRIRILRAMRGETKKTPLIQLDLDRVAYVMNQRPMGVYRVRADGEEKFVSPQNPRMGISRGRVRGSGCS